MVIVGSDNFRVREGRFKDPLDLCVDGWIGGTNSNFLGIQFDQNDAVSVACVDGIAEACGYSDLHDILQCEKVKRTS